MLKPSSCFPLKRPYHDLVQTQVAVHSARPYPFKLKPGRPVLAGPEPAFVYPGVYGNLSEDYNMSEDFPRVLFLTGKGGSERHIYTAYYRMAIFYGET